jgi:cytoskeletal protein RodZ
MDKIQKQTEGQFKQPKSKPEFKSSFKAWIRVVAFIIVVIFLPEQVAQARALA